MSNFILSRKSLKRTWNLWLFFPERVPTTNSSLFNFHFAYSGNNIRAVLKIKIQNLNYFILIFAAEINRLFFSFSSLYIARKINSS